jgi:hypothetical protein
VQNKIAEGEGRVLTWIFVMPVRGPLFPPQNPSLTQSGTTSSLWGHIPPVVKQCLSDWNILKRPFLTPDTPDRCKAKPCARTKKSVRQNRSTHRKCSSAAAAALLQSIAAAPLAHIYRTPRTCGYFACVFAMFVPLPDFRLVLARYTHSVNDTRRTEQRPITAPGV